MLDRLQPKRGSKHRRKRVGRGEGSGWGKTCGRGTKGAGARSGSKSRPHFEGGQMPMARRLPKFGFYNPFGTTFAVVNIGQLDRFDKDTVVNVEALAAVGLIRGLKSEVKVLGEGELKTSLKLQVHAISGSARQKVESAGGSVELISTTKAKPKTRKERATS